MLYGAFLSTLLFLLPAGALALSTTAPVSDAVSSARAELCTALRGARKLTLSPELCLPDPTDPTALLLRDTEVRKLSGAVRGAKGAAACVSGSLDALASFVDEQATFRGLFPGPVPVVYRPGADCDFGEVAAAGVTAVILPVAGGRAVAGAADVGAADGATAAAAAAGLWVVPELTVGPDAVGWSEGEVGAILDALAARAGGEDPPAVLMVAEVAERDAPPVEKDDDEDRMVTAASVAAETAAAAAAEQEMPPDDLPAVPKEVGGRSVFLGSVLMPAGDGRMNHYVASLKARGYAGAVLCAGCVPGSEADGAHRDLDFVGKFWTAAVASLRSTRSQNFAGFVAKNNMAGEAMGTKWANYQSDVMSSGALGEVGQHTSINDLEEGDYTGF